MGGPDVTVISPVIKFFPSLSLAPTGLRLECGSLRRHISVSKGTAQWHLLRDSTDTRGLERLRLPCRLCRAPGRLGKGPAVTDSEPSQAVNQGAGIGHGRAIRQEGPARERAPRCAFVRSSRSARARSA